MKVESGLYHSVSEVVRDGLRLLKQRDAVHHSRIAELRQTIEIGIDQTDRGQCQPFTEEITAQIKTRGRKRIASKNGRDPT